jgi:hypothetical protein
LGTPTSGDLSNCTFPTLNQNTTGTATTATNVTAVANNSTNETTYLTFVDGTTGVQGIETDSGLTYNPSSGTLTSTAFAGNVTGNVTGNLTLDSVTFTNVDSGSAFTDDDVSLMTSGAIKEKIEAYGYTSVAGDITQVIISSSDSSISGGATGASGNISFDLEVATIDGGTYT